MVKNMSIWSFDEIAGAAPDRAVALEAAGSPRALLEALKHALDEALDHNNVRLAREHAENCWDDWRAVVQLSVGTTLFDWFFNGRTGYRAHFRQDYFHGLQFNNEIIEALTQSLKLKYFDKVLVHELNSSFEDCGAPITISGHLFMASLTSYLSKLWLCSKRIENGKKVETLPLGIGGPKIRVGIDYWEAFYREANDAWLEVKGAFYGDAGFYQPKNPVDRALGLQKTGTA
jgi:hypothetical protein